MYAKIVKDTIFSKKRGRKVDECVNRIKNVFLCLLWILVL